VVELLKLVLRVTELSFASGSNDKFECDMDAEVSSVLKEINKWYRQLMLVHVSHCS
jgi:hypothetical protein